MGVVQRRTHGVLCRGMFSKHTGDPRLGTGVDGAVARGEAHTTCYSKSPRRASENGKDGGDGTGRCVGRPIPLLAVDFSVRELPRVAVLSVTSGCVECHALAFSFFQENPTSAQYHVARLCTCSSPDKLCADASVWDQLSRRSHRVRVPSTALVHLHLPK